MRNIISLVTLLLMFAAKPTDSQTIYGCYGPPDKPCTQHTLSCGDDEVIGFDDNYGPVTIFNKPSTIDCPFLPDKKCVDICCRQNAVNVTKREHHRGQVFNYQSNEPVNNSSYLVSLFNNCTNQPYCTISPPFNELGGEYDFVRYDYICIQGSRIYNVVDKYTFRKRNFLYLYFSGKSNYLRNLTCSCVIKGRGNIRIASTYINLGLESCKRIKILSQNQSFLHCTDDGITKFAEVLFLSNESISVQLDNVSPERDDVLWIELFTLGDFIHVSCTGCQNNMAVEHPSIPIQYPATSSSYLPISYPIAGLTIIVLLICLV
ncbi:uncharacterized protein LOC126811665 [Patella vulgata]|uniref:uncharacterized protein LOC126811665 n=1 Tax=Patella vulgata TaxID=6465 RepID=UPI00218042E2|nr:uncharacterized protein LOC126811665 [Patella vulgata]